jgi:energy-coupling factor transporter transmembrane protein EcfT
VSDTTVGPTSRIGPLSLLAACLLPAVGAAAIDDARTGLTAVTAEVLLCSLLVRDWRGAVQRLAFGALAAASIALTTWLYGGQHLGEATAAGCRSLYLVRPAALLTTLIDPSELGDHLAQRLHLPARLVVACVAALQRIEGLGETWRQVERARRARGMGLDGGPVRRLRASAGSAFALLVVSMRQAGNLATAMDARGFAGAQRRTWAEPARWRWADSVVLLVGIAAAAAPWMV